jgi:hypothetical protein
LQKLFHLRGNRSHRPDIFLFFGRVDVRQACNAKLHGLIHRIGLQLAYINASARHAFRNRGLDRSHEFRCVLFVEELNDHLGVIGLLKLRRHGEPETRPPVYPKNLVAFDF